METIINKKGNEGYTAQAWNFFNTGYRMKDGEQVEACSGPNFLSAGWDPKRIHNTIAYVIRRTRVHSCGKKVMRLHALDQNGNDNGAFRGQEFSPEMPIYVSREDAEEYIRRDFNRVLPMIIEYTEERIARYREEANPKAVNVIAAEEQVLSDLRDGTIHCEIVYIDD